MRTRTRVLAGLFAATTLFAPIAGCGDDAGEDEIGDGEIVDEGD